MQIIGVEVRPLTVIADERGCVMHMLKSSSELYEGFGEIYFSETNAGVIKGWKKHKKFQQLYAVPVGQLKLVIFDPRKDSNTYSVINEFLLGRPDAYSLLRIPANVWYSFKAVSNTSALIANFLSVQYDPDDSQLLPLINDLIPYKW